MKNAKRFSAIILGAAMAVSSLSVSAASDEDIKAALSEEILSCNMKMAMNYGVSEMDEELKTKVFGISGEELPKIESDHAIDMICSTEPLVTKMAMKSTVKMTGQPDTATEVYVDMNLADGADKKFEYIMLLPDTDAYMIMDYLQMPGFEDLIDSVNAYSPEKIKEINDTILSAVPEKEFTEKDGIYTMTFNDEEIKKVAVSMMTTMEDVWITAIETAKASTTAEGAETASADIVITDELRAKYKEQIAAWTKALEDVQLFAKDGFVLTASMDEEKHLKTMGFDINLDTNIYDVIQAVSPLVESEESELDEDTKALLDSISKENSNVKAYCEIMMDLDNVNGDIEINFPELTEDNSYTLDELTIDEDKINVMYNGLKVKFNDVEPIIENDRTLVPLRKFCNVIGIEDENIGYDAGVITIKNGDTTLVLTIDETEVKVTTGGEENTVTLDVPATIRNDRTLVPLRFVSENFNCDVQYEKLEDSAGSIITIAK